MKQPETPISIYEIVALLLRSWKLISAVSLVIIGAVGLYVAQSTPRFESVVTLQIGRLGQNNFVQLPEQVVDLLKERHDVARGKAPNPGTVSGIELLASKGHVRIFAEGLTGKDAAHAAEEAAKAVVAEHKLISDLFLEQIALSVKGFSSYISSVTLDGQPSEQRISMLQSSALVAGNLEKIASDYTIAKNFPTTIVLGPTMPSNPRYPRTFLLMFAAVVGGVGMGIAVALMADIARKARDINQQLS